VQRALNKRQPRIYLLLRTCAWQRQIYEIYRSVTEFESRVRRGGLVMCRGGMLAESVGLQSEIWGVRP